MRQVLDFILDADVYSLWQVTLNINVFILQLFIPPHNFARNIFNFAQL